MWLINTNFLFDAWPVRSIKLILINNNPRGVKKEQPKQWKHKKRKHKPNEKKASQKKKRQHKRKKTNKTQGIKRAIRPRGIPVRPIYPKHIPLRFPFLFLFYHFYSIILFLIFIISFPSYHFYSIILPFYIHFFIPGRFLLNLMRRRHASGKVSRLEISAKVRIKCPGWK